jgi:hypothetical protein
MDFITRCPDCRTPLWVMICGAELGSSDLIVCVACDYFATVGQVVERVVAPRLDEAPAPTP